MREKAFALLAALLAAGCLCAVPAFAEELPETPDDVNEENDQDDSTGPDAEQPLSGLSLVDGKLYYYNEDESLRTGYAHIGSDYYYFGEDGAALTGGMFRFSVNDKDYLYFFQEDGTAFTGGYKQVDGDSYYFLSNGQAYHSGYKTVAIDGEEYYFYFGEDCRAVVDHGETITFGTTDAIYYFDEDGRAYTDGLTDIDGDIYYFNDNGRASTDGLKKVEDDLYYFNDDGSASTDSLEEIESSLYYFGEDGKAYTDGLKEVASDYYYFGEDGKAYTDGLKEVESDHYYFDKDGTAVSEEFRETGGAVYYFGGDCRAENSGWFSVGEGYYFAQETGILLTDTIKEGYVLDESGQSTLKYRISALANSKINDSMDEQEKIEAVYSWLLYNDMTYVVNEEYKDSNWVWEDSWADTFAGEMLDDNGGNCFRYAAFLGYLIREATGLEVTVYHGTIFSNNGYYPHGWVTVNQSDGTWYYDIEMNKYSSRQLSSVSIRQTLMNYHIFYKIESKYESRYSEGVGTALY